MQYTKLTFTTFAVLSALSFNALAEPLPSDLQWVSNQNEPLFASSEAKRGGTLTTYMVSFPQTLRSVGPDANSGLRH